MKKENDNDIVVKVQNVSALIVIMQLHVKNLRIQLSISQHFPQMSYFVLQLHQNKPGHRIGQVQQFNFTKVSFFFLSFF